MSKHLICIAIDDEPFALELIKEYCRKVPSIELTRTFNNPIEASYFLKNNHPDIIFLDIKMPELSGMQLAHKIKQSVIIFTTAYSEFAAESYDLEAVDYLMKPFNFQRFYKAIEKAEKYIQLKNQKHKPAISSYIQVKVEYKNIQINTNEIRYIEAMDNYVKIFTEQDCYITKLSMKAILKELPDKEFFRIHKSYIVSKQHIDYFSASDIAMGNKTLPIGRKYSSEFSEFMS
ncbi:LytR/AlgR family response regulator transcription factor [Aureibacter tunicatorum]|uniref:DNA-binding LytR/AlgR family response regulator n=1 Tax=Aureibacter tunicatorum TaxID=866807 RepID=A0AAE3XST2_9BACT|nr:LytTR family DNA-binding domain-containing protein [Aureibacter tunicatorum]MDR6241820.1 DNA-binding LytR/AlgR family response regulator [Aureibacter tunicatorum]BDD07067.1 DNA-binding response regulator [Aureibacter tunicatorum]